MFGIFINCRSFKFERGEVKRRTTVDSECWLSIQCNRREAIKKEAG